jgi:hypothetical protein
VPKYDSLKRRSNASRAGIRQCVFGVEQFQAGEITHTLVAPEWVMGKRVTRIHSALVSVCSLDLFYFARGDIHAGKKSLQKSRWKFKKFEELLFHEVVEHTTGAGRCGI